LRSVATGESTTTVLTLNQPPGTQQNDVLVMVTAFTAGGTFTAPPGFTQFDWTSFIWAGWHVVGASDPGPYTFSFVSPQSMIGWIGSYVGVDTASPADPTHPKASTSGTSHSTNTNAPMSTAAQ